VCSSRKAANITRAIFGSSSPRCASVNGATLWTIKGLAPHFGRKGAWKATLPPIVNVVDTLFTHPNSSATFTLKDTREAVQRAQWWVVASRLDLVDVLAIADQGYSSSRAPASSVVTAASRS
jgi:hypothetical protein